MNKFNVVIAFSIFLCISVISISEAIARTLAVSVSSQTNVSVNGQSTGSITLSGSGGTAPYQYSKDGINFQSSPTFGALAVGNYTFTIKDAKSSTATITATITQPAALVLAVVAQTNVAVIGQSTGSVTLSAAGGTLPYQFSKDGVTYQSSATFGSLAAGNYVFRVKDASSSIATASVTITQFNILILSVSSQTNVSVIGQSTGAVTLSGLGGTLPYQYSKNGGTYQTSPTFSNLAAGDYTFTIRDAAFTTSSVTLTITQPAPLALVAGSKSNVSINGQSNGAVTLSATGGTPPYQYSKDGTTFQTSATFSSLKAGNYTFTVKDAASGTSSATASITQPDVLVLSLGSKTDIETYGLKNGTVTLSGSGGTTPYQYSKDGTTFQSTPDFSNLAAGKYTFSLRDAATATATLEVVVVQPEFKVESIQAMNNFSPNGDGVNDRWEIENAEVLPEHTLSIFDRGGRLLFKVRNYKNDWDGTVNGSALAEGTYYYAVSFDAPLAAVKKGFITLVK